MAKTKKHSTSSLQRRAKKVFHGLVVAQMRRIPSSQGDDTFEWSIEVSRPMRSQYDMNATHGHRSICIKVTADFSDEAVAELDAILQLLEAGSRV